MKRINKKLLEALDKLIAKYSGEELAIGCEACPLCILYWDNGCINCPNEYFDLLDVSTNMSCIKRGNKYSQLKYFNEENKQTLKQFWTDYKSLYLQRKYSNSEIMEILIKPFKEEKK